MAKKPKLPLVKPDFIIIGAPAAGGEIIKGTLSRHPKVWFPPGDNIGFYHSSFQIARMENFQKLLKGKLKLSMKTLPWLLRYFLTPFPTQKWYSKLLNPKGKDILRGELSDVYISLPFNEVEQMHRKLPNVKLVLMVRNPIERSYAALRTRFEGNRKMPFSTLKQRQVIALMNSDWSRTHGSVQTAIDTWPIFFPRENIFIGMYDELVEQPVEFFEKLAKFLNIEDLSPLGADPLAGVRPSAQAPFPEKLVCRLGSFYKLELEGLARRLGGVTHEWLAAFNAAPPLPPPAPKKPDEA